MPFANFSLSSPPQAASHVAIPLQFVELAKKPDYTQEVLKPLQAKQALKAAEDAREAARQAEEARIAKETQQAQTTLQAVPEPVRQVQFYPASDDTAKAFIYAHESGNNPGSVNSRSGACGLGQALPCSKMPCSLSDYACQDSFFTSYMLGRYGSWAEAQAFWLVHGWW